MALEKSIEQPTGATALYWRVVKIEINVDQQEAAINIAGYLSQEASDEEKRAIDDRWFKVAISETVLNTVVNWSYEEIKKLPEWEGAKDILEGVKE